ncbi:hypothetical protein DN752_19110 [Echinicola strongylocentroti]|uniref:HTH araC/xylS-type domain-containing protein n=1 Tax=Echinicola strongylocentroti TaxID=1795355 RepID=A0A2Z4IMK3_9BACT|nr:AraC family transcriptional regulator [Echinicola strongylocentroti]AWW32074.1 hypothetical protein DN752_19110 [Echinicola strongylocentroti]
MVAFGNPSSSSPEQWRLAGVLLDEMALISPSVTFLPTSDDPRIKRVTDQIIHKPAANPSLEESAELVCVSPRTLSRLFSKYLGMGYGEWKTRSKMVEALKLLEEEVPIKTIAYQLGYENASSFIYAFRKQFGKSPGNYYHK